MEGEGDAIAAVSAADERVAQLEGALLERTQRIDELRAQVRQKDDIIRGFEERQGMLDELDVLNQLTIRRMEREGPKLTVAPQDSIEQILRLTNSVKLGRVRVDELEKANRQLERDLRGQEKEVARVTALLEEAKTATGWDPRSRVQTGGRDVRGTENRVGQLKMLLQRQQEEQRTAHAIEHKRTKLISDLQKELQRREGLEPELHHTKDELRRREREIRELRDEIRTLRRVDAKRERVIERLQEHDDTEGAGAAVKSLEGDIRFLQAEIAKHAEARRQQERTIRSQQMRLDQLTARMASFSRAIRDLNLRPTVSSRAVGEEDAAAAAEGVTGEMFDVLSRDSERLRGEMQMRDIALAEKDAAIESLEKKLAILEHSRRAAMREDKARRREQQEAVRRLELAGEEIGHLREENARLLRRRPGVR